LASVDCVVAPSISEGFGSVHSEVSAMWKLLITTNVSSIPEVVYWKIKFVKACCVSDIVFSVWDFDNYSIIWRKEFDWDKTVDEVVKMYD
jgi:glycosyltransferase involved in cell wall biosynthesis